jgi:hypothetical protein
MRLLSFQRRPGTRLVTAGLLAVGLVLPAVLLRAADPSLLGSSEVSGTALIGIFYDFKQTQKRQPTQVGPREYPGVVQDFIAKGWDESALKNYFRAGRSLYATQIFIPLMSADLAPKAYNVQDVVRPAAWMAHYKGQVSPPVDGTYRFVGYADDVIAAAVNGKTVMLSSRYNQNYWKSSQGPGPGAGNGRLCYGDWMQLKKDQPIDLDVLIGEHPGGEFCAFLFYERQGVAYPTQGDRTLLPVFQLGPAAIPKDSGAPVLTNNTEYWKSHQ